MKKITIGIPRALLYYKYFPLWNRFFHNLDCDVVVSPKTNREIVERGSETCIDEACLSMKIYLGHVDYLKDKCDYLLLPRLLSVVKKEKLCTNFSALYDLTKTLFPDLFVLHYNIDVDNNKNEENGFLKMGRELGFTRLESLKAYYSAKREFTKWKEERIKRQQRDLKKEGMKILLVGHPYNLYDEWIGRGVSRFLKAQNITVLYSDIYDPVDLEVESETISKDVYWTYNKELLGAITHYKRQVDGIILLTTFPCGPDSLCNEMCLRKVKSVPLLPLIFDELNAEAGLLTRLESFIDILMDRQKEEATK